MPVVGTRTNASARAYGWSATIPESLDGMVLMMPSSIASTGTGNSSSIEANGSVTFSSCATLSLNGVFTTDYDNYLISIRCIGTGNTTLEFRFRASGTDNSTASSYTNQELAVSTTIKSGARFSATTGTISSTNATNYNAYTMNCYGPYLAQPTAWRTITIDGTGVATIDDIAGTHNQSTSYDGLSLIPTSNAITGLISVYGLEN